MWETETRKRTWTAKADVRSLVIDIDWYIIYRLIDNNVCKKKKKILTTQENYTFHQ